MPNQRAVGWPCSAASAALAVGCLLGVCVDQSMTRHGDDVNRSSYRGLATTTGGAGRRGLDSRLSTSGLKTIIQPHESGEAGGQESALVGDVPFLRNAVGHAEWTRVVEPPGSVLANVQAVYEEISGDILERWGAQYEHTTLFSGGMRFSDGGTVVENKMLNAVLQQGRFMAAFTGISTTAAHDCLYEQGFPLVLNDTMGRLMAAAGVRFQAINVAMGNTRPSPYSYCMDAHAGIDADIISWDMSMMVPDRTCGPAASAIELFIRSAAVLPRRPAVLIMDASPDVEKCYVSSSLRWHDKRNNNLFTGDCDPRRSLMKIYSDFGVHQIAPSSIVELVACGDSRFSRDVLFSAEEKDYPKPARWHPGPTGHLLLGDMLFMHYAKVFLSALERLDEAEAGITAGQLREKEQSSTYALGLSLGLEGKEDVSRAGGDGAVFSGESDGDGGPYMGAGRGDILPPPAWCTGWRFCEGAGNYRCASTYFPLAGREGSRLLDMLSERTPAVGNGNLTNYLVRPTAGSWAVRLNEESAPLLDYLKVSPPEGMHHPIDMKWALIGEKRSGLIEFEFETLGRHPSAAAQEGDETGSTGAEQDEHLTEDSRVVVCRPDFIEHVVLDDTAAVRFSVDGVVTTARPLEQYGLKTDACIILDAQVGIGRHTLAVEPLKTAEPYVAISYVLYPA